MATTSLKKLCVRSFLSCPHLLDKQKDLVEVLPLDAKARLLSVACKRGLVHDSNITMLLHSRVTYLDLSESDITDFGLVVIGSNCKLLMKLDLNSLKEARTLITDKGITAIARGCPRLSMLYIRRCLNLTDDAITAVAKYCPWISELNVSGCSGITDASLSALGNSSKSIQSLNLSSTNVTDVGIIALTSADCSQTLKEIHLEHCPNITDESIEAITQFCPVIENLLFHGCRQITEASRQALEDFLRGGHEMKHLTWTIY